MNCPTCLNQTAKRGFYTRPADGRRIQRYQCQACKKGFSRQTLSHDYRLRLRRPNQVIFRLICSGLSQRRCALIVGVKPEAISRRVTLFGLASQRNLDHYRHTRQKVSKLLIDELETFEHTKCKPLTVPIAVESGSRKILSLDVGQIAAKGHLAEISRKKYGYRRCERTKVLNSVFKDLKKCCVKDVTIQSDQSHHYPKKIRQHFPAASHLTCKGRRGCTVGQGELKRGGFDPLFTLNHSYAMFRDNLKTLARRTWCTVKRPDGLRSLLYMYAWFHNLYLEDPKRIVLRNCYLSI